VCDGQIVGRGHNLVETLQDATAHAEMQAITAASSTIGGKYLNQCTLYVTIEPCQMCAAAMMWCQLGRLVYGSDDPKRGFSTFDATFLHPKTSILKGVLESECAALTYNFFKKLR
jgi:tRNA(adenine34) deaminase